MPRDNLNGSWILEKNEDVELFTNVMGAHASAPLKLMLKLVKDHKEQVDITVNGDEFSICRHLPMGKTVKITRIADGMENEVSEMHQTWIVKAQFDDAGVLHVERQDKAKKYPRHIITMEYNEKDEELVETMSFDACKDHRGGTVIKRFKKM